MRRRPACHTAHMETTFDGCAAAFGEVIDRSRQERDRVGLFACMYERVTAAVRGRCDDGQFAEADRMEHFVCSFADRYFAAHETWRSGGSPTRTWAIAFEAARTWRPVVVQHLLLGMNAHINLDLGITTATLAGSPEQLPAMRSDFDAVNDVLASMVDLSQDELAAASPWFGLVDHLGGRHDEALISFSLRRARDQAWALAQHLVTLPEAAWAAEIDRVDGKVAGIARRILHPGFILAAGLALVRLREPWTAESALDAVEHRAIAGP
jgi:Family of unknown function (DUF5995)